MSKPKHSVDLTFSALTVRKYDQVFSLSIEETRLQTMRNNEVIIKVEYSSINYKDRLICAGNSGLVRRFPHIAGIDAVGQIVASNSSRFSIGDNVMVIATPLGVKSNGGFAEYVKVPLNWVMHIPKGLTAVDVATLGTAGFTAALAILRLEENETLKSNGPIVVTGGSGGVGMIAAFMLTVRGYEVELISSKPQLMDIFKGYNNVRVKSYYDFVERKTFPLLKSKYGGAIENLGGDALTVALRSLNPNAKLCAIGMAASEKIETSILPLILRGVHIMGINAESSDEHTRIKVWRLISETVAALPLEKISTQYTLFELRDYLSNQFNQEILGRLVVKI